MNLRILMVQHMPWTRNLGAPRVQFELAEDFRELGHTVDKFDINDAFPYRNRVTSFFEQALFPQQAASFIRKFGKNYDVIDAHQGNLPYSKKSLNFRGVLAARSCGLAHFFEAYLQQEYLQRRARGEREPGSWAGNLLRNISKSLSSTVIRSERSFVYADIINVLNQAEYHFVAEELGLANKVVLFPHGFRKQRFQEFDKYRPHAQVRYQSKTVVFIGYWSERKGSRELPLIVRQIRAALPQTRFLFLGTGFTISEILNNFYDEDRPFIEVKPHYVSDELPQLLELTTVGIFPSYCEGFPWVILEQLVAGIPVVAYDIPGTKETLQFLPRNLVSSGNNISLANRVIEILGMFPTDYQQFSLQSQEIGERFRNREIAEKLLHIYEQRLTQLKN